MSGVFKNLFLYQSMIEKGGLIYFTDITLHKRFPQEYNFIGKLPITNIVLDPVDGSVWLEQLDGGFMSPKTTMKEWLDSDGLCRTDTSSFCFTSG